MISDHNEFFKLRYNFYKYDYECVCVYKCLPNTI